MTTGEVSGAAAVPNIVPPEGFNRLPDTVQERWLLDAGFAAAKQTDSLAAMSAIVALEAPDSSRWTLLLARATVPYEQDNQKILGLAAVAAGSSDFADDAWRRAFAIAVPPGDEPRAEYFEAARLAQIVEAQTNPNYIAQAQISLDDMDSPRATASALSEVARAWLAAGQPDKAAAIVDTFPYHEARLLLPAIARAYVEADQVVPAYSIVRKARPTDKITVQMEIVQAGPEGGSLWRGIADNLEANWHNYAAEGQAAIVCHFARLGDTGMALHLAKAMAPVQELGDIDHRTSTMLAIAEHQAFSQYDRAAARRTLNSAELSLRNHKESALGHLNSDPQNDADRYTVHAADGMIDGIKIARTTLAALDNPDRAIADATGLVPTAIEQGIHPWELDGDAAFSRVRLGALALRAVAGGLARQGNHAKAIEASAAISPEHPSMQAQALGDIVRVIRTRRTSGAAGVAAMSLTSELWQRGTSWYH
jgi:hypothetical protein